MKISLPRRHGYLVQAATSLRQSKASWRRFAVHAMEALALKQAAAKGIADVLPMAHYVTSPSWGSQAPGQPHQERAG